MGVGIGLGGVSRLSVQLVKEQKKGKREQRGERREEWKVGPMLYVDATSVLNGPFNTV